ncbi:hypothetical protein DL96DRAFT_1578613 [Flagelloscypha sp. PMI_526]|nr:hypothetical protein DL96DRAFT_1578613 [Flagelloscypha sp. PMI_526]
MYSEDNQDPERQPLLSSPPSSDPNGKELSTSQAKTAEVLESHTVHWTIISLTIIDTTLVLIDLIYTFLSPNCGSASPESPIWLEVFSWISTGITAVFLIEIPFTIYAFGLDYFNPWTRSHAVFHILDALIIIATLILEVVLKGKEREVAGLLIVLRLWRIVKLVSGVALGASELSEAQTLELDRVKTELEKLKSENAELRRRTGAQVEE